MIYIFRKEIKKWTSIIWVFILSIPLGGLSYWIFRKPMPNEVKIAKVNGYPIYLNEYNHEVVKVQMRIDMLREYARSQGFPADLFMSLEGLNKPEEAAMRALINEKLIDKIHHDLGLELDPEYLISELGKSVPQSLMDRSGRVNERFYRDYLRRLFLSVDEFESLKENEFKRNDIMSFVLNSLYIPQEKALEIFEKSHGKKSFNILKLSFDHFLSVAKNRVPSDEVLKKYFEDNKENYKVLENRKAQYWILSKDDYEKNMSVDDEAIEAFYEKNKNTMFRLSPQVKVRKLVVGSKSDLTAKEKAQKILSEAKKDSASFVNLLKKYSIDKKASMQGGVVDFFVKGTYSPEFEAAAFRLKDDNEISDVIEDGNNYIIIQLIERKPAQVKPLDAVSDDIVKMIKERKSASKLRSDLELLLHKAKNDPSAINKFALDNKLKSATSDWLTSDLSKGYTLQSVLTQKIFEKAKPSVNYGYFGHEDKFVIFKEISRQESYIPPFDQIKYKVTQDYFAFTAKKDIKLFARDAKADLLEGKTTLVNLSNKLSLPLKNTGFVGSNDKVLEFEDAQGLISKSFDLTAKNQVLKFKSVPDYYLVQLEKTAPIDMEKFEIEKNKIIEDEFKAQKTVYLSGFIASLVRNARIDHYENSLNKSTVSTPIEYADID